MEVLILAAGYATRLYPLTLNWPKPLLQVGKCTILEHIFHKIQELDNVERVFIVTNSTFARHFQEWVDNFRFTISIDVVDDKTTSNENRLGAIRDIDYVIKQKDIDDDLLVIGGDNLFEFSLREFVEFSVKRWPSSCIALYDIGDLKKATLYGVVKIDETARVIGFREKPKDPDSSLIATCIYYFPKEKLGFLNRYLSCSMKVDAPGNYIKWLGENDSVYGFVFKDGWYDIGDIESLKQADEFYKSKL